MRLSCHRLTCLSVSSWRWLLLLRPNVSRKTLECSVGVVIHMTVGIPWYTDGKLFASFRFPCNEDSRPTKERNRYRPDPIERMRRGERPTLDWTRRACSLATLTFRNLQSTTWLFSCEWWGMQTDSSMRCTPRNNWLVFLDLACNSF